MQDTDKAREKERRSILIQLITKAFPEGQITISDFPWLIAVERPGKPRSYRVVLNPTEPLMTDVGNGFESIFQEGLLLAKQVLDNPPLKNRNYQGTIHLDNDQVEFAPRRD